MVAPSRISTRYAGIVEAALTDLGINFTEELIEYDVSTSTELYYLNHEGEARLEHLICVYLFSYNDDGTVYEARATFPARTANEKTVSKAVKNLWEQIQVERFEAQF